MKTHATKQKIQFKLKLHIKQDNNNTTTKKNNKNKRVINIYKHIRVLV